MNDSNDMKAALQATLATSRKRLEEALTLDDDVPAVRLTQYKLRRAFGAGAMLLFAAKNYPQLDADSGEAPDLTRGHAVLGLNDDIREMTTQLQMWDDWGSYQVPIERPPYSLEEAATWAQAIQDAFKNRFTVLSKMTHGAN
jgi:hypothetical protein